MLPLFFGFFTVKFFFLPHYGKKEPAIDIAGLCLPLKPQKEKIRIFFHDRYSVSYIPGCREKIRRNYKLLGMIFWQAAGTAHTGVNSL